jgi:succinyl-diaminopimelate desuccinylase
MTVTSNALNIDTAEIVELARDLIRIDTANPPGNEETAMRYLGAYLARWGIEVEYAEVEPGRPNLIARLKGEAASGHLVFSGHMDVVPPGDAPWKHHPFAADLIGTRIVGRGAADMKGGVAAMAVALASVARAGFRPAADLILTVSVGEEVLGPGARHMAETGVLAGSAYLMVGEPTGLDVCVAQKGASRWLVTAHGVAAHASTPHLGASAVSFAARAILMLETCPFPFRPHPMLGHPTVTVSNIQSSGAVNIVPDTCSFAALVRTVPGMNPLDLDARTQAILTDLARDTGGGITVETAFRAGIPAVETRRDHPLVAAVVEAVTAATGRAPTVKGFTGGTDAAILVPAFNLPFVICGPGRLEVAHQVNEWVEVAELEAAATLYALIAQRLLGGEPRYTDAGRECISIRLPEPK